jgi:hypothetical protein
MTAPSISRRLGITEDPCTATENSKNWDRVRRLFTQVFNVIEVDDDDGNPTVTNIFNDLVVYFKLTEDLDPTVGSASATKYEYDAGTDAWVASGTITVYDETTSKVWRGQTGYQGFARRKASDNASRHSILFLERIARDVWGTLDDDFSGQETTGTVSHYADGVEPDEAPLPLYDRFNRFEYGKSGAKFRAQYDYREGRYEVIECQQPRWIATATAGENFGPLTSSISISNVILKSWAEYDHDTDRPTRATNTFALSGVQGDLIHIQKEEDGGLWEIITGTGGGGGSATQLHRFRLYGNLPCGGRALAKRLTQNAGGQYVEQEQIFVLDAPYALTPQEPGSGRGMWGPGIPFMEGFARKREVRTTQSVLDEYEIVFMEMFGRFVFFELKEDMGATLPNQAKAKIALGGVFGQGDNVVDDQEFIVHDDNDLFHFAVEGAKGLAVRNEYMIDNAKPFEPYYQVSICQQPFLYGKCLLEGDMCPDDAGVQISELQGWTPSIYNLRLAIADEQSTVQARNTFKLAGQAGDVAFFTVEYDNEEGEAFIHILQVVHKQVNVVTGIRWNGTTKCIQAKTLEKVAVMTCEDEGDWEDVLCFEECLN